MRIAVTGLTGQVVSALIERAPHEVEMIALGRPQLDISVRDAVLATLRAARCDVIINAAAYTAVDKAESEAEVAMRVNGEGAGFVAEIAAELGVPLLHLSTDYVFDGALDRPYREDDPPKPTGAYGHSKLAETQYMALLTALNEWLDTAHRPTPDEIAATCRRLEATVPGGCRFVSAP